MCAGNHHTPGDLPSPSAFSTPPLLTLACLWVLLHFPFFQCHFKTVAMLGADLDAMSLTVQPSMALLEILINFFCHTRPSSHGPLAFTLPWEVQWWLPALTAIPDTPFPAFLHPCWATKVFIIYYDGTLALVRWGWSTLSFYTSRAELWDPISQCLWQLLTNSVLLVPLIHTLVILQEGPGIAATHFLAWCQHVCWGTPLALPDRVDPRFRHDLLQRVVAFYWGSPFDFQAA